MKKQDENAYAKPTIRKPIPAVPVAQFEAFKVYEDKPEDQKLAEQKKVDKVFHFNARKKNVEEDNNKLVEKAALAETTANLALSPMSDDGDNIGCPMSIEKSLIVCKNPNRSITVRPEREIFYEMPEYREDIYKYLREAEVHFFFLNICSVKIIFIRFIPINNKRNLICSDKNDFKMERLK